MVAERRFRAMGSDAHVIAVGGPASLALEAHHRIADLERRWSRFDPRSEVSALTRHAGNPVVVSAETRELVERAIAAWKMTGGRFDPTVLGSLLRAGYDRSFDELADGAGQPSAGASSLGFGAPGIEVVANAVRIPAGTGFDAGGIGKGLAADIVVDELLAAGARGACVNLGGDVRVAGESPAGAAWTIAVEHPDHDTAIARLGLATGAVATSTTLRRRWTIGAEERHHLIDPATGRPSLSELTFVTVVAGHAWMAEVLAKTVLLHGTPLPLDMLAAGGGEALTVDRDGRVAATDGVRAFLAEPLPAAVGCERLDRRIARAS